MVLDRLWEFWHYLLQKNSYMIIKYIFNRLGSLFGLIIASPLLLILIYLTKHLPNIVSAQVQLVITRMSNLSNGIIDYFMKVSKETCYSQQYLPLEI